MNEAQMHERWRPLATRLGLRGDVDEAFTELVRMYGESHRAYHNLDHVAACLATLDEVAQHPTDRDAVEMALWYHDAAYLPGDQANEKKSAKLALKSLVALGMPADRCTRVFELVWATDHSRSSIYVPGHDPQLIRDIDLVILAASADRYNAYAHAIEREADLSRPDFVAKRAAFLRGMLDRPWVFHTPLFRDRHEAAARANMRRELDNLQPR